MNVTFSEAVIVAVIGLVSGGIASLIAPWINWGIERRKMRIQRRIDLIKEWRSFIESFDFERFNFGDSTVYASMRPYMSEDILTNLKRSGRSTLVLMVEEAIISSNSGLLMKLLQSNRNGG